MKYATLEQCRRRIADLETELERTRERLGAALGAAWTSQPTRKAVVEEPCRSAAATGFPGVDLTADAAQLRILLESIPELVWFKDAAGTYVFCNQCFERFYGAAATDIVGRTDYDFVEVGLADAIREQDRRAVEAGVPCVNEERGVYRDDGHEECLETIRTPLFGGNGALLGVLGVARDITGRNRFADVLRDSEQRHRVIFENSPLGMIRFGRDGRILDCNNRFVQMMGAARGDIIGAELLRGRNPKLGRALETAMAGRPSSCDDYFVSGGGGREAFLHVQFNPVVPGRSPTEVIATLEDFSERKQDQDTLRTAKEQAEAFSRSKTEFLANMSHEIRTPLNGIMGMLQLIQSTGLDKEQSEYTRAALQSARRLMNLLTDILDLSRVEAGKLAVRNAPFDLVETCEQVCDLFRLTSAQSGVDMACELGADVPRRAVGDAVRLQQILTNLMGNAFKFTDSGRVVMAAHRLPNLPSGGYRILFYVSDTGAGIPDSKVGTLFDAFTQVSRGHTRRYQGAGLGLSICRNLVSLMGGNMAIESEEGVGTTLYVSLPFDEAPGAPPAVSIASMRGRATGPLSILLAEDERVNSLVIKRILEKAGHTVTGVENGEQVLAALRGAAFDVILMDIQMPVMDGVETSLAIRAGMAGEERADIPIVAVTAYAMVGDREKFLAAGMDGYVVKPVERRKLLEALEIALSGDARRPVGGG
ncbi:PAS domain-containing hybrid sensor histidine kinase/response regulator [Desulfovibrio sp. Fe33]|uniref:PAS domain-containing hybrid sensor histidine kinase/response regulator n=1 Tax=Desulfovibrio sp. Fe33 TaxID=3020842 RepID=UPI00234CB507|nr:PAS domain-containing hybrid sensor histidine kinase/response regulator [Desulfovibrio sp. Fe33]